MTLADFDLVRVTAVFALNVFGAGMVLAMIRLLMGPTLPDRVVALDLIAALAVGVIAVYAILTEQPMLLRAAIVVALVVFVGTVAFAMFLEKRGKP
jgi:multicomponent Na+:H+ antiporter subunit F